MRDWRSTKHELDQVTRDIANCLWLWKMNGQVSNCVLNVAFKYGLNILRKFLVGPTNHLELLFILGLIIMSKLSIFPPSS